MSRNAHTLIEINQHTTAAGSIASVLNSAVVVVIKYRLTKIESNRQLPTMAPGTRSTTSITHHLDDYYQLPAGMSLSTKTIPFGAKEDTGMGTMLNTTTGSEKVLVNSKGDAIRLNETKNPYAVKLAGLILVDLRERKDKNSEDKKGIRTGERVSFNTVIISQMKSMAKEAGYEYEKTLVDRRCRVLWDIMRAFNSTKSAYNEVLNQILLMYIKRRFGITPGPFDEFEAAVNTIQDHYVEVYKKENQTRGAGQWTFPGVHLLNGHLIALKLPTISFHPVMSEDVQVGATERKAHDTFIHVGGEKARVESREEVIQAYTGFAKDFFDIDLAIPEDEGEPSSTTSTEGEDGVTYRSFNFPNSSTKKRKRGG